MMCPREGRSAWQWGGELLHDGAAQYATAFLVHVSEYVPLSLALPFQTAKQLAAAVRKKKIGCLELLDLYLARTERYNPGLNAIVAMDIEAARGSGRRRRRGARRRGESWGPLHGVPMTIKDSFDVAGMPTTWGARPARPHRRRRMRSPWPSA